MSGRLLATLAQRAPRWSSRFLASAGYRRGPVPAVPWSDATARRQDDAWRPIVAAALQGSPREDVAALWAALDDALPAGDASLLEVGCGSGYVSDLIAHRFPSVEYRGADLSPSMIDLARQRHPDRVFEVADATALPAADGAVDVVLDGVALIHIPDWRAAIAEYVRVARDAVVLHGVTLTVDEPTFEFSKYAYGQPSTEWAFSRADLLAACAAAGLEFRGALRGLDYDLAPYLGVSTVSETWLLRSR